MTKIGESNIVVFSKLRVICANKTRTWTNSPTNWDKQRQNKTNPVVMLDLVISSALGFYGVKMDYKAWGVAAKLFKSWRDPTCIFKHPSHYMTSLECILDF